VGTEKGLNLFDKTTEQFTRFRLFNADASESAKAILTVTEDHRGWIWVGTWSGGLHLILTDGQGNLITNQTKHFQPTLEKASNNVWDIFEDNQNRFWVASHGAGLMMMDVPKQANNVVGSNDWQPKFYAYTIDSPYCHNLKSNTFQVVAQDNLGHLWFGTTQGLYRLKANTIPEEVSETQVPLNFEVFLQDSNNPLNVIGNNVMDIFEDEQGLLWIATSDGLSQYNWYSNQLKTSLLPNTFYDLSYGPNIYVDAKHNVWLGVTNNGLLKFKLKDDKLIKSNETFNHLILGNNVSTIHSPDNETLFVGTERGLTELNLLSLEKKNYIFPEFKNISISTILQDSNNTIWVGSKTGLFRIDPQTNQKTLYEPKLSEAHSISDHPINHVIEDSRGAIWVATYKGLNRIADPSAKNIKFEKFFYDEDVPENGPIANEVMYLKESNEGLFHVNKEMDALRSFDERDGLYSNSFQLASSAKDKDGNLYFGTAKGITHFQPKNLKTNKTKPPVYITDVELMNPKGIIVSEEVKKDEITLSHDTYRLSINFAALNYNRADKNKFEYKLNGFENNWNEARLGIPIVYTNLKPGNYDLQLRASNNDGVWNNEGVTLAIVQEAAFWETWWFRLLATIFLLTLLLLYTNSIRKRNEELQMYVKTLNEEISNRKRIEKTLHDNNVELKRSNKDLEQFAYVSSHDLKEPLRSIGNFSSLLSRKYKGKMDKEADEYIGFIESGVQRMFMVINSLLTYSIVGGKDSIYTPINLNTLLQEKIQDLSQLMSEKNARVEIDDMPEIVAHKEQIGMVFFNLISNALKFNISEEPKVVVSFLPGAGDHWKFSVQDNGIGIPMEYQEKVFNIFNKLHGASEYEGTGIGLAVCRKIVSRHQGEIWFDSELEKGFQDTHMHLSSKFCFTEINRIHIAIFSKRIRRSTFAFK